MENLTTKLSNGKPNSSVSSVAVKISMIPLSDGSKTGEVLYDDRSESTNSKSVSTKWRKLSVMHRAHGKNKNHRGCYIAWIELERRLLSKNLGLLFI